MAVQTMREGDLARALTDKIQARNLIVQAYEQGRTLSRHLNEICPPDPTDTVRDAFSRVLRELDIRTRSLPEEGVYASRVSELVTKAPYLYPEFVSRQWRAVTLRAAPSVHLADAAPIGSARNPYTDAERQRPAIAAAIPLSEVVAMTTPIERSGFRAMYLSEPTDTNDFRKVRVSEAADIPLAKVESGENEIRLHKYGRGIKVSYEQMREMTMDKLTFFVQRLAIRTEVDKLAAVIDIMVNGDGNPNTAATSYNLTTLDSGTTANNLTLKAWLAFKMKFPNPYTLTSVLAQESAILSLMLLTSANSNTLVVAMPTNAGFGAFTPINQSLANVVRLGWTTDAPSAKLVGFDNRFAIEQLTQIGADINETARYAENQTEALYLTETQGFMVHDPNATKILNLAA